MATPPASPTKPAADASDTKAFDPVQLAESLGRAAEKSAKLMGDFVTRNAGKQAGAASDELGVSKAFMELAANMLANPARIAEGQLRLWHDYMNL